MNRGLLIAILTAWAVPAIAAAQHHPWPGAHGPQAQADQHQQRMDRLRIEADIRTLEIQRQQLQTRQTLQRLESQRDAAAGRPEGPIHAPPPIDPAVSSRRHEATREAVGQIDSWLDRSPD